MSAILSLGSLSLTSDVRFIGNKLNVHIDIQEPPKSKKSEKGVLKLSGDRSVVITPKKQIEDQIKRAEKVSREADIKALAECDENLAKLYKQFEKSFGMSEFIRIARLELPNLKALLIVDFSKNFHDLTLDEDHGSPFAEMLEGHLTDEMLSTIAQKYAGYESAASKSFCNLLRCLKKPDEEKSLYDDFRYLQGLAVEDMLTTEMREDFVKVVLSSPKLSQFLATDADAVTIEVRDHNNRNNIKKVCTSALLLSHNSSYFQSLLQKSSDPSTAIDLRESSFDSETISMFLQWIHNPLISSFAVDEDSKEKPVEHLERLLTQLEALALRNEDEFLEKMQLELAHALNDNTIYDVLELALRFKLKLAIAFCIDYINGHYSNSIVIRTLKNGNYEIIQNKNKDISPQLNKALALLGNRVESVSLSYTEAPRKKGCLTAIYRLGKCSNAGVQKLYNLLGGVTKRTGICWLSIYVIQKAAHLAIWPAWKMSAVSVPVAVAYPCIAYCFQKCVINLIMRRRRHIVVALPALVPMCIQRPLISCAEKASNCFNFNMNSSKQHALLSSLPKNLPILDLSNVNLTDDVLRELLIHHPNIEQLTLGLPTRLTQTGMSLLSSWANLKTLTIHIHGDHSTGILNEINFRKIFGDREGFKFKLEISDKTAAYYSLKFLEEFPKNAEVHITLSHILIPPSLILFESRDHLGRDLSWPGSIERLARSCPQLTHFTCNVEDIDSIMYIRDNDLIVLGQQCPQLLSLSLPMGCPYITNNAFEALVKGCKKLEELCIGDANKLTDVAISMLVQECTQLKKVTISGAPLLTNAALEHLAKAPKLNSCELFMVRGINDVGVRALLARPIKIENLHVQHCENVSQELCRDFLQYPLPNIKGITFEEMIAAPIPHLLGKKTIAPLFFQFLIENLSLEINLNFIEPQINTLLTILDYEDPDIQATISGFQHSLGLSAQSSTKVRTSQIKALSLFPLESFFSRLKSIRATYGKPLPYSAALNILYNDYTQKAELLKKILMEWSPKIEESYRDFLSASFPQDYVKELTGMVEELVSQLKVRQEGFLEPLHSIPLRIFNKKSRQLAFLCKQIFFDEASMLYQPYAKFIDAIGKKTEWTNDQRAAAFFAGIFFNWSWLGKAIFTQQELAGYNPESSMGLGLDSPEPRREASVFVEINEEKQDRKEEKSP